MGEIYTLEESKALKDFREAISDILDACEDEYNSHDSHLIRWLRARDLNVTKAEKLFRDALIYRKEHELDKLKDLPLSDHLLELFPIRPLGHNKEGYFVATGIAANFKFKEMVLGGQQDELRTYVCHVLEKYFQFRKSTHSPDNIKYQMVVIGDCAEFPVAEHMKISLISFGLQLVTMLDLNYPEILKTVYIINVPPIFSLGWSMVAPFLSPYTVKKIRFIKGGPEKWKKALLEDIDCHELPAELGGTNTAHPAAYTNANGFNWPSRAKPFPTTSFVSTVVPAREKFIQSFELSAGKRISWNFKTDSYDIGFEFTFDGVGMFPYARADAHLNVQDGLVDVLNNGTYSLVFDNSYSKYRSKTLQYAILVEDSPVIDNNET